MNFTSNCSVLNVTSTLTDNGNFTNPPCPRNLPLRPPPNPFLEFFQYAFASSFYLIALSFITILANSSLIWVFIADPLKTFRKPTTYFLIGLAITDLITALITEPFNASCFMMLYLGHPKLVEICFPLLDVARMVGAVSMTISFLIIFSFTFIQYIVVVSPLKYAPMVTKKKVLICVVAIYGYAIFFWTSQYYGTNWTILESIDLFFHSLLVPYSTILIYILLHRAFKRKMQQRKALRSESNQQRSQNEQQNKVERRFITLNLLLISIMFICSQPMALRSLVVFFKKDLNNPNTTLIINLMTDNVLYLKFMLDPFVYAWRIPNYRQALKLSIKRGHSKKESGRSFQDLSMISISKSTETVVSVSFRSIPQE